MVKERINTEKYATLTEASDRLAYLRSLAINTLITEAASIFIKNETAILNGEFSEALLDKSHYKAQIDDIIKISIEKVYKSTEVIDKEIAGYNILSSLLDVFTTAFENYANGKDRHYDRLILKGFENRFEKNLTLYELLMECCNYISRLTDGNALQIFQKNQGNL